MHRKQLTAKAMLTFTILLLAADANSANEYFVGLDGNDEHDGLSLQRGFQTIQRGVDALEPGDTLTIAPGEYFGSVRRTGLGGPDADTVIRAEIPGTVVLRGDVPAPAFRKVEGYRFVYAAEFAPESEVESVSELDTLTLLESMPNIAELDFIPGSFFHDRENNTLYISTPDLASAAGRRYAASVTSGSVLELTTPRRVRIEGLAVTGAGHRGSGIALLRGNHCVISDCRAYFNPGTGIYIHSGYHWDGGDNIVERCAAWANGRGFWCFYPRDEILRDSTAFLNTTDGFWLYARASGTSRLMNNLAWGNGQDFQMKTGAVVQEAERCVGIGGWCEQSRRHHRVVNSLVGRIPGGPGELFSNTIIMQEHAGLEPDAEFADPANRDYRLQATSRFRGAGKDGADLGLPYEANIFYVAPGGDDAADGLSRAGAWATLDRALAALGPGDTLYLEAGRYRYAPPTGLLGRLFRRPAVWRLSNGVPGEPVRIRGRGEEPALIEGDFALEDARELVFERLVFADEVSLRGGENITFEQCAFAGGLDARNADGLRVVHCEFTGAMAAQVDLAGCAGVFLAGNRFANAAGAALAADRLEALLYADYNAYLDPAAAWKLAGQVRALSQLPVGFERYGSAGGAGTGLYGRPAGNYRLDPGAGARLVGPFVHSVSATSANIEWFASRDAARRAYKVPSARVEIGWGETPECENTYACNAGLSVPRIAKPGGVETEYYGGFSLTDLEPGTRYYVKLRAVKPSGLARAGTVVEFDPDPVSFTTAERDPDPTTWHVSPAGDDGNPGTAPDRSLRTLHRAGELVRPGDTVLIAGGIYRERLRIRATGTPGRPITFAARPGAMVTLDGDGKRLINLIESLRKRHLRFDGLHLANINLSTQWTSGAIRIFGGEDIRLTRIFYDGRAPGYSPKFVYAGWVRDLLVRNCASINTFGGPCVLHSPGFRMENCAIVHSLIGGVNMHGSHEIPSVLRNNIFTDCLSNKISVPIPPFASSVALRLENNAHFLRPERTTQGNMNIEEFAAQVERDGGLLGDPRFAVLFRDGTDPGEGFTVDQLLPLRNFPVLTFTDLFATNPAFVERGIGLDPAAFADFHFNQ